MQDIARSVLLMRTTHRPYVGMATTFGALLGATVSCTDDGTGGPCGQRTGTYLIQYEERSGTCGPIPEQIDTSTEQPTAIDPPCTGGISYSDDNCDVTYETSCPANGIGPGYSSTGRGKVTWDESGSSGSGTVQYVVYYPDMTIACQSTYDVVATRL